MPIEQTEAITEFQIAGLRFDLVAKDHDNLNCVGITHLETESAWFAYRRHVIEPGVGVGKAYYWVCDMRGWEVGTANTISGLAFLLTQAVEDMGNMFAAEAEHAHRDS